MIIIRADGGKGIGMGHLMRTSVLAKELLKTQEVFYICDWNYKEGKDFLESQGFNVILSENPLETLLLYSADCILTDSYRINDYYIHKVRDKFNFVGYIDDNILLKYEADFIINQNFGAEKLDYSQCIVKDLLLGTQYLLLREEFRKEIDHRPIQQVQHILLTVGGSDLYNYAGKLLNFIYDLPFIFHVVIGPIFPYKEQLIKAYRNTKNVIFESEPKMSELIKKCDLAISSCGSTLYELGVMGIPIMGYVLADNQQEGAIRMSKAGLIEYIGTIDDITKQTLRNSLLKLSQNQTQRANMLTQYQAIFNPFGVEKIIKYLLKQIEKNNR